MPNNVNIICNPNRSSSQINSDKLLSDLGRPTRRGVKKCPSCGYLNGTRGYMCKNSVCNTIFKDSDKKKMQLDSLKLLTSTSRQIYSVCVRDKCPDARGFVQLPLYEGGEKNLFSEVALCFVDTCQRLFDDSILKCHESESAGTGSLCAHIDSALKSVVVATALEFKHDLINSLKVDEDVKKKLCLLAKSTDGPVVQKVSRNVMVVKCAVTPTNPLGYLHLLFCSCKASDNPEEINTFLCGCADSLTHVKLSYGMKDVGSKCIHYYAAACAFASDGRFTNRFSHFVQTEFDPLLFSGYELNLVNMLEIDIAQENIPILHKDTILEFSSPIDIHDTTQEIEIEVLPSDYMFDANKMGSDILAALPPKAKNKRRKRAEIKRCASRSKVNPAMNYFDVLSFNEWLPSVTECINSTIYYGCTVKPEQLVFHIPNRFFELLKDRICFGTKLQLADDTRTVHRSTPPLGRFTKSCWHINDVIHLKQIFDTNDVSLKTLKYFTQNTDSTFTEYEGNDEQSSYLNGQINTTKFLAYIKVGNVSGDQKDMPAFTIEWTGDLFKVSKFGELRLVFQLGHQVLKK